jgi:hypothetical protein
MPRLLAGETEDVRGTLDLRQGTLLVPYAGIPRTDLAEEALTPLPVDLTEMRDALTGLSLAGVFGTDAPTLMTDNVKASTATAYARFRFCLPESYVTGHDVQVRVRGGMLTTVADTSATVDIVCYEDDEDGGISADLCTTAAQSINSLTKADKDFVITATSLAAGSMLDIRVTVAVVDAATVTAVAAEISSLKVLVDLKG